MSHILLNKWEKLKTKVLSTPKEELTRNVLINILLDWAKEIKPLKDKRIQELYEFNLKYFEDINLSDYQFSEVWYSLDYIIKYDFLNASVTNYERPIAKVGELLWNLIIFKSNKDCPQFSHDDLRAFTDTEHKELYLSCDICLYNEDIHGKKPEGDEKWIPAPAYMIEKYNLKPSIP